MVERKRSGVYVSVEEGGDVFRVWGREAKYQRRGNWIDVYWCQWLTDDGHSLLGFHLSADMHRDNVPHPVLPAVKVLLADQDIFKTITASTLYGVFNVTNCDSQVNIRAESYLQRTCRTCKYRNRSTIPTRYYHFEAFTNSLTRA